MPSSTSGGQQIKLPKPPKAPESLLPEKKKVKPPMSMGGVAGNMNAAAAQQNAIYLDPSRLKVGGSKGGGTGSAGAMAASTGVGSSVAGTGGYGAGTIANAATSPYGGYYSGAGMGAASAPATGFAAQYTPQALINGLDPNIMAADILGPMGVTNMDIIEALGQLGEYGLLIDFLTGGPADERGGNMLGDAYNNQAGFMQNLVTAGGSMPNANELMDIILNAPPDSYIGQFLLSQGPEGVNQLLEAVMGIGMTPYYRQAAGYALDQELLNQQRGEAKGDLASRDGYYGNLKSNPLFGGYF